MKLKVEITKVEVVSSSLGWLGRSGHLEVSCGDDVTFRVDDKATARRTYVVGRSVAVTITPGGRP